jgi:hypothetical protein
MLAEPSLGLIVTDAGFAGVFVVDEACDPDPAPAAGPVTVEVEWLRVSTTPSATAAATISTAVAPIAIRADNERRRAC